jgi:hypothetical protein
MPSSAAASFADTSNGRASPNPIAPVSIPVSTLTQRERIQRSGEKDPEISSSVTTPQRANRLGSPSSASYRE